jgi:hypothetical protein
MTADPTARWRHLRELWHAHDAALDDTVVGLPPRLWTRWGRDDGAVPMVRGGRVVGASHGEHHEVWGDGRAPGAAYAKRLWGWGTVDLRPAARAAWTAEAGRWLPLLPTDERPRVADGPGFLLVCLVDAVHELIAHASPTDRDLAILWGTLLLPVLALGRRGTAPLHLDDGLPTYVLSWPFHLLHPRAQVAVLVLDEVCTLATTDDHDGLSRVLVDAGLADPGDGAAARDRALVRLLEGITRRALRKRAADRWDSGFGFRLARRLMRQTDPTPGAWDEALHGALAVVDEGPGDLAKRLRDGLRTGLSAPLSGPDPSGTAAAQVVELTWSRWTDPLFLDLDGAR